MPKAEPPQAHEETFVDLSPCPTCGYEYGVQRVFTLPGGRDARAERRNNVVYLCANCGAER